MHTAQKLLFFITLIIVGVACSMPKGKEHEITIAPAYVDLLNELSDYSKDTLYIQALSLANKRANGSSTSFVAIFEEAWKQVAGDKRMAAPGIFGRVKNANHINPYKSTNADVIKYLDDYIAGKLDSSVAVIKARIQKATGTEPDITVNKRNLTISVKFYTNNDPQTIENLFLKRGDVAMWESFNNSDIYPLFENADKLLGKEDTVISNIPKDSTRLRALKEHPLAARIIPNIEMGEDGMQRLAPGCAVGYVEVKNRAIVESYLSRNDVKALFPYNCLFVWQSRTESRFEGIGSTVGLFAIKIPDDGIAPIHGKFVTDANYDVNQDDNRSSVNFKMDAENAIKWKHLTGSNIGKSIAITIDGYVYTAPTVNSEIPNGSSTISGSFTLQEAKEIANILQSGPLPVAFQKVSTKR